MLNLNPYIYKYHNEDNNYYIMREDLLPFSFGGNKVRKNIYYFNDLISGGYDHVVSYGSEGSNHARVVANFASRNNIKCTIITPQTKKDISYNSNINKVLNVNTIYTSIKSIKETIENEMEFIKNKGESPYFIQGGGHGYLGSKAYVDAYRHISNYSNNENIQFDYIFFASGTGATQAGLIIGNQLNNCKSEIIGISVARPFSRGAAVIEESINEYYKKEKIHKIIPEINFDDDYVCGGYGKYNKEIKEIVKKYYVDFGIPLDTTYTGKAVYGMHSIIKKENIKNKNILFIHTGGTPLFFDFLKEVFQ